MRPRCCLRCLTFWASTWLLVVLAEVRGLVVLAGAALDLFLLGQQALEVGIDLLDELLGLRLVAGSSAAPSAPASTGLAGLALVGTATAATGGDDAAGPGLAATSRRRPWPPRG